MRLRELRNKSGLTQNEIANIHSIINVKADENCPFFAGMKA